MGTTNTRIWLVNNGSIVERITEQVGLRDAARERNPSLVREALRSLITAAFARAAALQLQPECILAAGMLTSPLGLCEVPHLVAPAGERELSQSLVRFSDPSVSALPIYLVPGIRSGPAAPTLDDLDKTDLLRGEETLVVGLLQEGTLTANSTFLNLGSHWKAIAIDAQSRIDGSFTTLSGELLHALQTQTVLAESLPQGRFEQIHPEWLEKGRAFESRHGASRAMFAVRLLQQLFHADPLSASSFLLGALVSSDLKSMDRSNFLRAPILIAGSPAVSSAFLHLLTSSGRSADLISSDSLDRAFVLGLLRLYSLHLS
jgi:2-dehydro-3-deoxygalactonokinase